MTCSLACTSRNSNASSISSRRSRSRSRKKKMVSSVRRSHARCCSLFGCTTRSFRFGSSSGSYGSAYTVRRRSSTGGRSMSSSSDASSSFAFGDADERSMPPPFSPLCARLAISVKYSAAKVTQSDGCFLRHATTNSSSSFCRPSGTAIERFRSIW